MHVIVRTMTSRDGTEVLGIYREGIASGNATFNTDVPSWADWDRGHLPFCRHVAELQGEVLGWAALAPVSERAVYEGVAEISIYVGREMRGLGVGARLLAALIEEAELAGLWTLQSRIFPENVGSMNLHRRFGFREVGRREKLGKLAGQWRDLLLFERRSSINGL